LNDTGFSLTAKQRARQATALPTDKLLRPIDNSNAEFVARLGQLENYPLK
jgi:hypothetical protein